MSARNQILLGPLLIALAALAATLATIAPEGSGPGVTCDEPYHVYEGKQLVTALRQQGLAFFRPANIERNFDWKIGGPPVQAPLGYWILGWTHYLFDRARQSGCDFDHASPLCPRGRICLVGSDGGGMDGAARRAAGRRGCRRGRGADAAAVRPRPSGGARYAHDAVLRGCGVGRGRSGAAAASGITRWPERFGAPPCSFGYTVCSWLRRSLHG